MQKIDGLVEYSSRLIYVTRVLRNFSLFLHPLFSYYFFAEYSMYLTHLFLLFLQAVEVYPFNAPGIFGYFSSKFFGKETIDELFPSVGPPSLSSVAGAASKLGNETLCGMLPIVIGIGSKSKSKPAPSGSA